MHVIFRLIKEGKQNVNIAFLFAAKRSRRYEISAFDIAVGSHEI